MTVTTVTSQVLSAMPLICHPTRSSLEPLAVGNGRHGAEHAQGGVDLPHAQDEAERALTEVIEDAMADGEIDESEQEAILKKVSLSSFSLAPSRSLSPCLPPSCTVDCDIVSDPLLHARS